MWKKAAQNKRHWAEERRAWFDGEERTGQAVRRYLSEEAFATDLQRWLAAGWKVRSKSGRELTFRVRAETLTRELLTVTYCRELDCSKRGRARAVPEAAAESQE